MLSLILRYKVGLIDCEIKFKGEEETEEVDQTSLHLHLQPRSRCAVCWCLKYQIGDEQVVITRAVRSSNDTPV